MSLVVSFRFTRCDVKESVEGRVCQRYPRGQDVKVLQLADVTAKVTIPYWLIIQDPVFVRPAIKPGPTALTN